MSKLAQVSAMPELTKITGHHDQGIFMRYNHPRAEGLAANSSLF